MSLWASNKDRDDNDRHEHRKRIDVKRKRATKKIAAWKEGMKKNKRARKSGCACESGMANAINDEVIGASLRHESGSVRS